MHGPHTLAPGTGDKPGLTRGIRRVLWATGSLGGRPAQALPWLPGWGIGVARAQTCLSGFSQRTIRLSARRCEHGRKGPGPGRQVARPLGLNGGPPTPRLQQSEKPSRPWGIQVEG